MRYTLLIVFSCLLSFSRKEPFLDKTEAKKGYEFLNDVRTVPKRYIKDLPFLKSYHKMPALRWNDTLASVAEAKALDMATRNYFAHTDPDGYGINYYIHKAGYKLDSGWLRKPTANFFESCNGGGPTGLAAIKMLLIDEGVPSLGHRNHLLGIDSWSATLKDIGIGYVRAGEGKQFKTYTCVIIAKHSK